jgi:hypothetical protein
MTEAPWQDAVNNIESELDRLKMLKDWGVACRYVWTNPEMALHVERSIDSAGSRFESAAMSAWRMGHGHSSLYRIAHELGQKIIDDNSRQEGSAKRLIQRLSPANWEPPTEVAVEVDEPPKRRAVKKR